MVLAAIVMIMSVNNNNNYNMNNIDKNNDISNVSYINNKVNQTICQKIIFFKTICRSIQLIDFF